MKYVTTRWRVQRHPLKLLTESKSHGAGILARRIPRSSDEIIRIVTHLQTSNEHNLTRCEDTKHDAMWPTTWINPESKSIQKCLLHCTHAHTATKWDKTHTERKADAAVWRWCHVNNSQPRCTKDAAQEHSISMHTLLHKNNQSRRTENTPWEQSIWTHGRHYTRTFNLDAHKNNQPGRTEDTTWERSI